MRLESFKNIFPIDQTFRETSLSPSFTAFLVSNDDATFLKHFVFVFNYFEFLVHDDLKVAVNKVTRKLNDLVNLVSFRINCVQECVELLGVELGAERRHNHGNSFSVFFIFFKELLTHSELNTVFGDIKVFIGKALLGKLRIQLCVGTQLDANKVALLIDAGDASRTRAHSKIKDHVAKGSVRVK